MTSPDTCAMPACTTITIFLSTHHVLSTVLCVVYASPHRILARPLLSKCCCYFYFTFTDEKSGAWGSSKSREFTSLQRAIRGEGGVGQFGLTSDPGENCSYVWPVKEATCLHKVRVIPITLTKQSLPHPGVSIALPLSTISVNAISLAFLSSTPSTTPASRFFP